MHVRVVFDRRSSVTKHKAIAFLLALFLAGSSFASESENAASNTEIEKIAQHYVVLGHEMFADALHTATVLHELLEAFVNNPSPDTQARAKHAWIEAHAVYSQTEVFRFGNPNVDDWEGRVNAWPMDEGLVDYVANSYEHEEGNPHALENLIASDKKIDQQLLRNMHEVAGSEANVATGYHVIEFLLWGQDLNTDPNSGGQRSFTDYLSGDECTHPPCDRRAQYLISVSQLLKQDLEEMVAQWDPQTGSYAKEFSALDNKEQVRRILFGMGNLSFGELAAERIRVALLANAQEDEQSCFSDTTNVAIYNNALAVRNIYFGYYKTSDGREIEGPSVSELIKKQNAKLHEFLEQQFALTLASAYSISEAADQGEVFDQQILADNAVGNARLQKMIDRLKNQTNTIEKISEDFMAL